MKSYSALAQWYNILTGDVPYNSFADFYESEFQKKSGEFSLILDLCCGTGTLTCEMAKRGYELISVDSSPDMLMQAQQTCCAAGVSSLLLCQDAVQLDLYGTVDACFSSLDSINYISPKDFPEVLRRLHLFIRPGGLFLFDIRSEEWMRSMDGKTYVDETDDVLCLWRADYDDATREITYGMNLFSRNGKLWKRQDESHMEYAYSRSQIFSALENAGFCSIQITSDCPQGDIGRLFVICERAPD